LLIATPLINMSVKADNYFVGSWSVSNKYCTGTTVLKKNGTCHGSIWQGTNKVADFEGRWKAKGTQTAQQSPSNDVLKVTPEE